MDSMSALKTALLAGIAAYTADDQFSDTCAVYRNVGDTTTRGGQIDDWRRVSASLAGRLTGANPAEDVQGEAMVVHADCVWHCAASADIKPGDQIVTGGRTYDVIGSDGGRTDALVQHVRVVCVAQENLRA